MRFLPVVANLGRVKIDVVLFFSDVTSSLHFGFVVGSVRLLITVVTTSNGDANDLMIT